MVPLTRCEFGPHFTEMLTTVIDFLLNSMDDPKLRKAVSFIIIEMEHPPLRKLMTEVQISTVR